MLSRRGTALGKPHEEKHTNSIIYGYHSTVDLEDDTINILDSERVRDHFVAAKDILLLNKSATFSLLEPELSAKAKVQLQRCLCSSSPPLSSRQRVKIEG